MTTTSISVTRILYGIGAITTLLAVLAAKVYVSNEKVREREINEFIQRETRSLELEAGEVKDLRDQIATYLERKQAIETIARHAVPAAEGIAELSRLPGTVVLKSVTIQGRRMSVSGEAESEGETAKVLPALLASGVIAKARITGSRPLPAPEAVRPARQAFTLEAELVFPASAPGPAASSADRRK